MTHGIGDPLHPNRIVHPGVPWKEVRMSYLSKLSKSLNDDTSVGTEFLLAWIAIMLTSLAVLALIDVLVRGFGT